MALRTVVVTDDADLEPHIAAWDALAVACAVPMSAPAWMLAFWRKARPAHSELRVVLVHDGDALVGVGPYFVDTGNAGRPDYRLLTSGLCHRMGPLAAAGREAEVAAAIARGLAACSPRPALVSFEGVDRDSLWPSLMRDAWPSRIRPGREGRTVHPSPVLLLDATDYAAWYASRSRNFRHQLGRFRRRLEKAGGEVFLATAPEDVEAACAAFPALHVGRWEGRGGSSMEGLPLDDVLRDAARTLPVGERLRLWCVRLEGRIISVQVMVAAGGELAYWTGGWDDAYAELKPPMASILAAIEDAYARGDDRLDFGGGAQDYKRRFVPDIEHGVVWTGILPLGPRYLRTRAELAPRETRRVALRTVKRLPPGRQAQLKQLLRRG